MTKTQIKKFILKLGFTPTDSEETNFQKQYSIHKTYSIKLDFKSEKIDYGSKIELGDETTANFSQPENFVVLECVNRLLEKGYEPQHLYLEKKWTLGRTAKGGKADISVADRDGKSLLIIECKTWGKEYEKEKTRMIENGGQLFSYLQQDKNTRFLCLYTSTLKDDEILYDNAIVQIKDREETLRLLEEGEDVKTYKEAKTNEELHEVWKENYNCYFAPNGIFDEEVQAYNPEHIPIKRKDLKPFVESEGRKFFNQFEEILRHNNISDKSNAFNRILSLILCKIVDEKRDKNELTDFQIIEGKDTPEKIQERLQKLYAKGMGDFLNEEIVNYSEEDIDYWVNNFPDQVAKTEIKKMLRALKFYSNNEFAFKEVHNEKLFLENAKVLNEIITLLQFKQFRYYYNDTNDYKHQKEYLGNFFELLLDAGYKQSEGQFFTPLPVARFIIKSIPFKKIIENKLKKNEIDFLPFVMDYACGSGHFLTEAIEEIQHIIDEIEPKYDDDTNTQIKHCQESTEWTGKYIYGIEKDYRLARTAKVACFMNGDGQANIFFGDGLEDYNEKERSLASSYDVVIANPPYAIHGFKPHALYLKDKYSLFQYLTDSSSEIEVLFVERTSQLLHTGGMAGIILPSSILSNAGIYSRAREIILQNFIIKGIVELGANAFMATGTNTIVLFMEKREERWKKDYWHVAEDLIYKNKKRKSDFTDSENLLKKYIEFLDMDISAYKSVISKKANDDIKKTDWFKDYKNWFEKLTDVKRLKNDLNTKAAYKDLSDNEKQEKIDNLFYEKVLKIETEKFYYFLLTHEQEIVLTKTGNDLATTRKFLGYEFKKGRQAGMVMYYDENNKHNTSLYDETNLLNPQKANYYVYQNFLNCETKIDDSLKTHISKVDLVDCMDFKRVEFEKQISLAPKAVSKIKSKYSLVPFDKVAILEYGAGLPENKRKEGEYPVMGSNGIVGYHNEFLVEGPCIIIGRKGSAGKVNYIEKSCFPIDTTFYIKFMDDTIPRYFYYLLSLVDLENLGAGIGVPGLNRNLVHSLKIPKIPKDIQENIVREMEAIEKEESEISDKLNLLANNKLDFINGIYSKRYPLKRIIDVAQVKGGKRVPKGYKLLDTPTDYPYLRVTDFQNCSISEEELRYIEKDIFEKIRNYTISSKDIYISIAGTIGLVGIVPKKFDGKSLTENAAKIVLKNYNKILQKYILYVLLSDNVQQQIKDRTKALGVPKLALNRIETIEFPLPKPGEQKKIVSKIDKINNEMAKLENNLSSFPQKKEAVLKKYL